MGFLSLFRKAGPSVDDEPFASQAKSLATNPMVEHLCQEGCDRIEGASGPFGSKSNPIPVNGPIGEVIYINRLRSGSGAPFFFHRTGNCPSSLSDMPLDRFELISTDGSEWRVLYFAMYFRRRSQDVPEGLARVRWSNDAASRVMLKTPTQGVLDSPVADFPAGLPQAIHQSGALLGASEKIRAAIAGKTSELLNEMPSRPSRPKWVEEA